MNIKMNSSTALLLLFRPRNLFVFGAFNFIFEFMLMLIELLPLTIFSIFICCWTRDHLVSYRFLFLFQMLSEHYHAFKIQIQNSLCIHF